MFVDCNKDMSTWLLVYGGFMAPMICILIMIIFNCALPSIFLAMKERSDKDIIISLLPCIIFTIAVGLGIIIFNIASTIYGAVLFFPVTSGPYPVCSDNKDGKPLVVTGTIIVAFKIIFCFFQILIMPTNVNTERSSSGSVHITNWSNRMESLELQTMNIGIDVEQDPGRVDDVPGDPVHEHKLVTFLKALGRNLMFY